MFTEVNVPERFKAASDAGFKSVEYLFPYGYDAHDLKQAADENDLRFALINSPPGNTEKGERGLASLPDRRREFETSITAALEYAAALAAPSVHVMAGIGGDRVTYIENLRTAVSMAPSDLNLMIEPINSRNIPGYHLNTTGDALSVLEAVGADNLRLQFDLFHCQISEGDLSGHIRDLLPFIGHIQIAGVPERHEPDVGEKNYPYLFDLLDELRYDGFVGCEYHPKTNTIDGLGWFQPYLERQ